MKLFFLQVGIAQKKELWKEDRQDVNACNVFHSEVIHPP